MLGETFRVARESTGQRAKSNAAGRVSFLHRRGAENTEETQRDCRKVLLSSENVGQDGILSHVFSSFPGEFCELVNDSSARPLRSLRLCGASSITFLSASRLCLFIVISFPAH